MALKSSLNTILRICREIYLEIPFFFLYIAIANAYKITSTIIEFSKHSKA